MNMTGFLDVRFIVLASILFISAEAIRYNFRKKYVRNHLGKKFVVFHVYRGDKLDCGIEAHITTDEVDAILIDVRTPRLSIKEGGFRKSQMITRDQGGKLCVPHLKEDYRGGTSNNAVVFESVHLFSLLISTHVSRVVEEIHVLYPVEAWGDVYYLLGHGNSLVVIVALEKDTRVDLSDCAHVHQDLKHFENYKQKSCPFHEVKTLERYEAYFERDGKSGHVVMANKRILVKTETTEGTVNLKGTKATVTGYAAVQFLPVEKWDRMFVFPLPRNPRINQISIHVTVEYNDVDVMTLNTPITSIYWRHDSHFPHKMTEIIKPNNVMDYTFDFDASHNIRLLKVCVSVRASAVLLFHTKKDEGSALGITNLPPISHFDKLFIWSHSPKQGWEYYFYFISPNDGMSTISLTRNGNVTTLVKEQVVMYYEYSMFQLTDSGTYRMVSESTYFMVYLEAYNPQGYSTLMSELGSRHKDVESDCTCHFEMKTRNDAPNRCDDEIVSAANRHESGEQKDEDEYEDDMNDLHVDFKGEYQREEWGSWMCDDTGGFLYRNRSCKDALLESAGFQCKADREEHRDKLCNTSTKPCPEHKWGPRCEKKCPDRCEGKISCNRVKGTCTHGCKSGYHGPLCNIACHIGYGGKDCKKRCSSVCPSKLCDPVTLACKEKSMGMVTIGMILTSLVVFVVCPGVGYGLYVVTLMRSPPERKWKRHRSTRVNNDNNAEITSEIDGASDDSSSGSSSPLDSPNGEPDSRKTSGSKEEDVKEADVKETEDNRSSLSKSLDLNPPQGSLNKPSDPKERRLSTVSRMKESQV